MNEHTEMEFPASELPLTDHGKVYHLNLSPEMVAEKIILVGDPDRVAVVSSFFDSIDSETHHREFTSRTGTYKGKRITALSTGIGIGNIDITVNELDALVNIDLSTRRRNQTLKSLEIVRIGTCGLLQADLPIHAYVLSKYAFALDNVADYYDISYSDDESEVNAAINAWVTLPDRASSYVSKASPELFSRLESEETYSGITITSCGFYGPQGRQLRLPTKTVAMNDQLSSFSHGDLRVTNFEMESSALFALGRALGHHCATVCLGIANRPLRTFSEDYHPHMLKLIQYVLDRI